MEGKLNAQNVATINYLTELNFDDAENVTYQNLIDARKVSLGMAYGEPRHINGSLVYVLPTVNMGLVIKEGNTDIKMVTREDYLENYLPTFDVIEGGV